ncbi:MAG: MFS transporter [Alphaproteobacteria bacterium]|nr:MFS transporter [Alphaproteobacteria bacterium]
MAGDAFPSFWPQAGLWRDGNFVRLWVAQTVSAFGSRISRTAWPLVGFLTLGAGPAELGLIAAMAAAPAAAIGLLAGGWVDRRPKRPVLIGADLARAGLLLWVPLAAWMGWLDVVQVTIIAGLTAALGALYGMADLAFLPALLSRERLVEGRAKLTTADAVVEIVGPAAAGALIQALTAPIAILLDALSFLASAAVLAGIRVREKFETAARAAFGADMALGWRLALSHDLMRPTFLTECVMIAAAGTLGALYSLYAIETLGLTPVLLGVTVAVGGVGAVLGAMAVPRLVARHGHGPAICWSFVLGVGVQPLVPLAPDDVVVGTIMLMIVQFVGDAALTASAVANIALRQAIVAPEQLGRLSAVSQVILGVLFPLGALGGGFVGEALGARAALWVAALAMAVSPLLWWGSRLWRHRQP